MSHRTHDGHLAEQHTERPPFAVGIASLILGAGIVLALALGG